MKAVEKREAHDWYFIQGIHRSGTTILGTWLQETEVFRTLTLADYVAIMNDPARYPMFDIVRKGAAPYLRKLEEILGRATREFDNIRVEPGTFEEFSHLTMNEPPFTRPWRIFAHRKPWNQFNPKYVHMLGPESIQRFKALSGILGQGDKRPQLYKNPFDVANPFVYGLDARHIFIFRNPIDILNSMISQVHGNYRQRNLYVSATSRFYRESYRSLWYRAASRYGSKSLPGARVLAHRVVTELNTQMDLIESLDPERYVCVEYEYMCQDENLTPDEAHPHRDHTIGHILRFFKLDPLGVKRIKSRTRQRNNPLPPEVLKLRPSIEDKLSRYYEKMRQVRKDLSDDFSANGNRSASQP